MPVPGVFPGSAQGDLMQHGDIVPHHRGFADDNGMGMVDEDAAADTGGGMDVHGEDLTHPALQEERQVAAFMLPQPVGDTVGLESLVALVVEKGFGVAVAGRVAVTDGDQVLPGGVADGGFVRQRVQRDPLEILPRQDRAFELLGQQRCQRMFEIRMVEHHGLGEMGKDGFTRNQLLHFRAH